MTLPTPRCSTGDMAWVIKSVVASNLRKIVTVNGYIGYFNAGDGFEHSNLFCRVPITDHYWWISNPSGIDTAVGPTTIAVCPDTWLEPIKPTLLDDDEEVGDEVYNPIVTEHA